MRPHRFNLSGTFTGRKCGLTEIHRVPLLLQSYRKRRIKIDDECRQPQTFVLFQELVPSVLSLHREGRDCLEFRSNPQEISPLLLGRLSNGPRSRSSSSQATIRSAISRTTTGNSCRVILLRRSRRRGERAEIPTRLRSRDDHGSAWKKPDSKRLRSAEVRFCSCLPRFLTTQYPSFSFFFRPRTKSMMSCFAPLSTRSGLVRISSVAGRTGRLLLPHRVSLWLQCRRWQLTQQV